MGFDNAKAVWHSIDMNKLNTKTRAQLIATLVEGNSMRAVSRMTGVAFNTVLKFVVDMGEACREFQDGAFRNLNCRTIELERSVGRSVARSKSTL
jgi:hypothetical protein